MAQRLSNGLPQLYTSGNQIIDVTGGDAVLLQGVCVSGLEYSSPDGEGSLSKANIDENLIMQITGNWNANVIRVPFNQDWALERPGYDPTPYRSALEAVISWAANHGAYTILDLQWLDAQTQRGTSGGKANFVPPLPDVNSIAVWQQLATLWPDETAIIYDVLNEPHDPLPDDAQPLIGIRSDGSTFPITTRKVGPNEWTPWARQLINAVRSANPNAVALVGGTNWAFDLRGCIMSDLGNVIYSSHVYPWKGTDWDATFGQASDAVPVFAGEWGGGDNDLDWGASLANYFAEHGIGWTAWSWVDYPPLNARSADGTYSPTKFGEFVQHWMQNPAT